MRGILGDYLELLKYTEHNPHENHTKTELISYLMQQQCSPTTYFLC